ncbi:hypothetical protein [Vibrio tritonius]|uniref:hypothetical protein n=1 Tax=Vibrio tritonius TaxID=1435069 RepID=UPI00315DECA5
MAKGSRLLELLKALEAKNSDAVSSFRPMSARLDVIAHLNAQALTDLDERDFDDFQE